MDTFAAIVRRVTEKKRDYTDYGFNKREMAALNAFFDLAQEYDGLENLYLVSVAVPKVFLGVESNLYVTDPNTEEIRLAASSFHGTGILPAEIPTYIRIVDSPYRHDGSYVVPIHGKKTPASRILLWGSGDIIGLFEVVSEESLGEDDFFFIQKYVNRVGYNLYNKLLAEQNIQHLKFINNLVADVEHNVIIPNFQYKYYFKTITRYLNTSKEIEGELENILESLKGKKGDLYGKLSGILEWMVVANRNMFEDHRKIERHYKHTSLFLETLFRRDHFLFGQYVLRKTRCLLWKDLIVPQLERYADRFARQGIGVKHILAKSSEEKDIEIKADRGLIAQVLANLFSNAEKYAQAVGNGSKKKNKYVDCHTLFMEDFFGPGYHGIQVQVYSSGPPIDEKDSERVFDEGFRLAQPGTAEGSGHGLHFVKNVIEVHGGIVGHRPEENGNQFFFIIPA